MADVVTGVEPGAHSTPLPPGPPPLGAVRRSLREFGLGLITLGVIVLLFVAYQLFGTNLTEARNQSSLARQFQTAVHSATSIPATGTPTSPATSVAGATAAEPPVDVLPSVPPGGAIEHLVIPAIGVDKYVVEGTNEADLRRGPGHYIGTAFPGQVGNTAIAGHRTTYGAPFFELNQLKIGDPIELTDLNDRTWVYVVSRSPFVVSPSDVSVLDPTSFPQLTLTTCNPRFSATSRLVVIARLRGQAARVTSPSPATVQKPTVLPGDATTPRTAVTNPGSALAGANLGQGQSSAWLPSILYGILVIAVWVLTRLAINRTRRWYRLGAYVFGIGICLIPLWFCFENVVLLLPQSI